MLVWNISRCDGYMDIDDTALDGGIVKIIEIFKESNLIREILPVYGRTAIRG